MLWHRRPVGVIQTCVFRIAGSSRPPTAIFLAFGVKELGKDIKAKFHDTPTGFFILRSEDMH
jgi:hypothetical protein